MLNNLENEILTAPSKEVFALTFVSFITTFSGTIYIVQQNFVTMTGLFILGDVSISINKTKNILLQLKSYDISYRYILYNRYIPPLKIHQVVTLKL